MLKKITTVLTTCIMFLLMYRILSTIPYETCLNQLSTIPILPFLIMIVICIIMNLLDTISCFLYLRIFHPIPFHQYYYIDSINRLLDQTTFPPIPDTVLLTKQHQLHIPITTSLSILLWERYLNQIPTLLFYCFAIFLLKDWLLQHTAFFFPAMAIILFLIVLFVGNALLLFLPKYAKGSLRWIQNASFILKELLHHPFPMLINLLCHTIYLFLYHSIILGCAFLLHLPFTTTMYLQLFLLSIIVDLLLMMIPIMGKHGIAETAFLSIFTLALPENILFSMMLLWRIFTYYIPVLLHCITFTTLYSIIHYKKAIPS